MSTLLVRKLELELVERLKPRAAAHGRSAEARHRAILRAALQPQLDGGQSFEMLRADELWPEGAEPDSWRCDDPGESADV